MPGDIMGIEHHQLMLEGQRKMTKDEALAAWDEATNRLMEVKERHRRELALAKQEFALARDAFIDVSSH